MEFRCDPRERKTSKLVTGAHELSSLPSEIFFVEDAADAYIPELPISGIVSTLGIPPLAPRRILTLCDRSPVYSIYRPYFLPEILPGLEKWHPLGGDSDCIACSGFAPFPCIAASGPKTAGAAQLDLVALPQSFGNARQQDIDDGFRLSLGKVESVGNSSSEF